MSAIERLLAIFDWRSMAVLRRNALVYLRNWRTAFVPPALEPVIFFVALGLGLGRYVGRLEYGDGSLSYASYVAPGLLAYTFFVTPFYEALYSSYVRMFYQKTWDGMLATQVELPHVLWGEILWAGVRGAMNAVVVAITLAIFAALGLLRIDGWWLPVVPFVGLLSGWAFAAFGLVFTAIVPSIDHMNYPVFLVGVPLGFVSNTYFPLPTESTWVAAIAMLNPVLHLAETFRSLLVLGTPGEHFVWLFVSAAIYLILFAALAQRLMRKRVLGETR